jgi:hypothetical protein
MASETGQHRPDHSWPIRRLPKSGDVWPEGQRKLWLELIECSFKLIYNDKSDSKVRSHDESMESVLKKD